MAPPGLTELNSAYQALLNQAPPTVDRLRQAFSQHDLAGIQQAKDQLRDLRDQWTTMQRRIAETNLGNWVTLLVTGPLLLLSIGIWFAGTPWFHRRAPRRGQKPGP